MSRVNNCVLITTVVSTEDKVAEIAGWKAAFDAFDKESSTDQRLMLVPGLNVSQNQLFFLSYAQVGGTQIEEKIFMYWVMTFLFKILIIDVVFVEYVR